MILYNKLTSEFDGFYIARCTVDELNQQEGTDFVDMSHIDEKVKFVLSAVRPTTVQATKRVYELAQILRATGLVEVRTDYASKDSPVQTSGVPVWEKEELEQLIRDGVLLTEVKQSLTEQQIIPKEILSSLRE